MQERLGQKLNVDARVDGTGLGYLDRDGSFGIQSCDGTHYVTSSGVQHDQIWF